MSARTSAIAKRWGLATALVAGAALATPLQPGGFDGWSTADIAQLATLRLSQLSPAPHDPSNAVEALPAAKQLGERIFSDRRFSANGAVSCATCHQPARQFQDGLPLGQGIGIGARRTMPLAGAAHAPFLFWDGRRDSLWSQALGPLEDPLEHGGNRLAFAHLVDQHYRGQYEAVFGALPKLSHLPDQAGPLGTPAQRKAWSDMSEADRDHVSRIFSNLGKAIAAFEKNLLPGPSRLDRYVDGLVQRDAQAASALTAQEKKGLRIFIGKGQCITCHNGPLMSDQHFHNTGVAPRLTGQPDAGRQAGIVAVQNDEFNCLGRYSDASSQQCGELRFLADDDPAMASAFKTPGLRDVTQRSPYMHAGQLASLEDVVRHYAKAPAAQHGHSELKPVQLSEQDVKDLVAFLASLDSLGPASAR